MMLPLYRLVSGIGAPAIGLYLAIRKARGKEDPDRFAERLGHPGGELPSAQGTTITRLPRYLNRTHHEIQGMYG